MNGQPPENTWEKRPKAVFWWCIYCTNPYARHHCSKEELKEQMIKIISSTKKILEINMGIYMTERDKIIIEILSIENEIEDKKTAKLDCSKLQKKKAALYAKLKKST